jgi:hypothetical protein
MRPALLLIGVLAAEPSVLVHPASDADHVEPSAAFSSAGLVVTYVERAPMHQAVLVGAQGPQRRYARTSRPSNASSPWCGRTLPRAITTSSPRFRTTADARS